MTIPAVNISAVGKISTSLFWGFIETRRYCPFVRLIYFILGRSSWTRRTISEGSKSCCHRMRSRSQSRIFGSIESPLARTKKYRCISLRFFIGSSRVGNASFSEVVSSSIVFVQKFPHCAKPSNGRYTTSGATLSRTVYRFRSYFQTVPSTRIIPFFSSCFNLFTTDCESFAQIIFAVSFKVKSSNSPDLIRSRSFLCWMSSSGVFEVIFSELSEKNFAHCMETRKKVKLSHNFYYKFVII